MTEPNGKMTERSSTPMRRANTVRVRESLGRIKKNTVSGMVNFFTQKRKKYAANDLEEEHSIAGQISFFNDISCIKETTSEATNYTSMDSGYDTGSFRHRSKSCGSRSVQQTVIDSYAAFPNFKWSQLKYFGVDPKEYLSQYNIDLDTINEITPESKTITSNHCGDDANEIDVFDGMRERSQTVSINSYARKSNDQNYTPQHLHSKGGSGNVKLASHKRPYDSEAGLKSKVQETIKDFENIGNVRRMNTEPAPDFTNLKLRIRESIKGYGKK